MTRDKNKIGKRQNTMTNTLINRIGLEDVEKLWVQYGCYKAAEKFSRMLNQYISFSTIRYLSQALDWTRPINPKSAIYVGFKRGTILAENFPHLIFSEGVRHEKL